MLTGGSSVPLIYMIPHPNAVISHDKTSSQEELLTEFNRAQLLKPHYAIKIKKDTTPRKIT